MNKTLVLAALLLSAACGNDDVTRESSRADLCAATCACETDASRPDCESACINPRPSDWPVWPNECVIEIANCVKDAETCRPYFEGQSVEHPGTQVECWYECADGMRE